MDNNINPFNPGAGVTPPELAGRSEVLDAAYTALERVRRGKHAKSLMILGLRGVGKTVLLNQIRSHATETGYLTEIQEAHDGAELKLMLIPLLRKILLRLDRVHGAVEGAKKGLRVLRSWIGPITVSSQGVDITLGVEPEVGYADSGVLEDDLKDVLVAVGEAAKANNTPVAILIDELQYLPKAELGALIRGLHAINQAGLPLIFFGAGLPQLAGQAGDAKSYAERLFDFPRLDALSETRPPPRGESCTPAGGSWLSRILEKNHERNHQPRAASVRDRLRHRVQLSRVRRGAEEASGHRRKA